jgi:sarcosine oxidase
LTSKPHVLVLGLGIAGSSIAAELACRGYRVTALEQFSPLHERGSSHGDTRIFRRVPHEGPVYVEMAAESAAQWLDWNRLAGERLFIECGGVDAGFPESKMVEAAAELCERYGQPFESMDGRAFNRRYGSFRLPEDWRVIYQPASGVVRPDATRSFLLKLAGERGARLLHQTTVLGLDAGAEGVRVRVAGETLTADLLVVAAGSWLPKLFPELPLNLRTERRVLAWFRSSSHGAADFRRLPIFVLDADGGWYGMPTPDGRLKIGHDKHLRERIDPDREPIAPDENDAAFLSLCTQKFLRGFEDRPGEMKSCIYTLTEDHHFLIDWHPAHSNVLLFSCCSGHGFKYAPVYGKIAAQMIAGETRAGHEVFRLLRGAGAVTRFSS